MPARVTRQENDVAAGEFAGQKFVRGRAERRADLDPFLIREALDVIKPAAADDADSIFSHKICVCAPDNYRRATGRERVLNAIGRGLKLTAKYAKQTKRAGNKTEDPPSLKATADKRGRGRLLGHISQCNRSPNTYTGPRSRLNAGLFTN